MHGSWTAWAHTLTPERDAWISAAHTLMHSDTAFLSLGLTRHAATVLRDSGWTTFDVVCARQSMRLDDEETAVQASAHVPLWWAQHGWWEESGWTINTPRPTLLTPAEARTLAEQGVNGRDECVRRWKQLIAERTNR
ncbi:hypothetical protein GCM10022221_50240 [Actinocorallia aurea]